MTRQTAQILAGIVIALIVVLLIALRDRDLGDLFAEREFAGTARIVDGDSLEIGTRRVRLFGIDAPELDQPCRDARDQDYPCGEQARVALRRLIADRAVRCLREGRDRFGRVLARCHGADGEELNTAMIRAGWALAYAGADGNAYRRFEREAQRARLGLWSGRFIRPEEWRRGEVAR